QLRRGLTVEGVDGAGLAILTGNVTSPTVARLLGDLLGEMPQARWYRYEASEGPQRRALRRTLGRDVSVRYDLAKADVVLAVDSDFLNTGPGAVAYSKAFSKRREVKDPSLARQMARLYSVETTPTSTSTVADHRLALKPTDVGRFLAQVAAALGVGAGAGEPLAGELGAAWLEEVVADLKAHRGTSAIIVGDYAAPELHQLAMAVNEALGNVGETILVEEPVEALPADDAGLEDLLADIGADRVSTLLMLDVNPVYAAPAELQVTEALDRVPLRIHQGLYFDETAEWAHWHIPKTQDLEAWGDSRGFEGTATLRQPIVNPLYDSRTQAEVVAALLGRGAVPADELLRETWSERLGDERGWRRALHQGFVDGDAGASPSASSPSEGAPVAEIGAASPSEAAQRLATAASGEYEVLWRPDPSIGDGRYANIGWLQELPNPITKLTWDNALLASPATVRAVTGRAPFSHGDTRDKAQRVRLTVGENVLDLPIWPVPGLADGALLVHLGYGRRRGGQVADGLGFDVAGVRTAQTLWQATEGVEVREIGGTYVLASTQDHFSMEGRQLVQESNVEQLAAHPDTPFPAVHLHVDPNKSIMDQMASGDWQYDGYAWAMSIDLTSCTGCNACIVACQSENNIPVVGKDQVAMGREMHWIRVDRYFVGDDPNAVEAVANQPVPCMQCEQAPCEVVCPVAATVHSDEGLNDMVYNRCVGTRYCSNNCPYKVRRFNFLLYQDFDTPQAKLGRNPDVTVRSRGVMEKCTYCVQRINSVRIDSKREGRPVRDGEILTACQQVCPSDAIIFGNKNDPESAVAQAKSSALDYSLLAELGVRPRTTYIGRVRNPNPRLWERLHPDRPLVVEGHHGDHYGKGDHGKGDHGAAASGGSGHAGEAAAHGAAEH
ncbi:MAG: molybdopterin oxidoreductase, partial [Acidobacteriota bacterium]